MNKNDQILIVDDEPNVRLTYRMVLEAESYVVTDANCGKRALEQLGAHKFDLILLDLQMPEMDGLQLLEKMRASGCTTPCIIITAHGDVPHAVRALKLGAIDFLQKPLTPVQLRQVVSEVLDRHAAKDTVSLAENPDLSAQESQDLYLQEVKRLLNLQEFGLAKKHLAQAMSLDFLSVEAFNLAGVLFEMQEDYERARKYYAQAVKLDPHYQPAQQNIRRIFELLHLGSCEEPVNFGTHTH